MKHPVKTKHVEIHLFHVADKTRSQATAEIARIGGHYAVQGHLRSVSVPTERSYYATSYRVILMNTTHLHPIS